MRDVGGLDLGEQTRAAAAEGDTAAAAAADDAGDTLRLPLGVRQVAHLSARGQFRYVHLWHAHLPPLGGFGSDVVDVSQMIELPGL